MRSWRHVGSWRRTVSVTAGLTAAALAIAACDAGPERTDPPPVTRATVASSTTSVDEAASGDDVADTPTVGPTTTDAAVAPEYTITV
ncbi:MAG: hypothetical protein AAFP84_18080, partial [Actinomycetota bacterium]